MTTMTYSGYQAVIEFDDEAEVFHGEVAGLRDVITFQGKSVAELKKAFRDSVDDYLAFCRSRGEEPEKPFSGQFIVRTAPQTHRLAVMAARAKGISLNAFVTAAIENASGTAKIGRLSRGKSRSAKKVARRA
jgi:predicted HicB family RNase H-like nuclease